jgi:arylsulfatase A
MKTMKRACSILFILVIVSSSCKDRAATSNQANIESEQPNIVYIYADDLGYNEVGVYGQEKIKTPHLNKMANEGIMFTQHYTSSPVCAPARSALLTGLHTGHSYIRSNLEYGEAKFNDEDEYGQEPLPEGTITLGTILKEAGYTTGAIGKWGLGMTGNSGHPNKQGFDYFYGYLDQKQAHNYYPTHLWENDQWDSLDNPFIYVHNARAERNEKNRQAIDAFAKSHLKPGDEGFFDAYKGKEYAIDAMTAKAEKFIRENKDDRFFLYLPYTIPHVSLQVPDSALQQYLGMFEEEPYLGDQSYTPHKYPKSAYAAMITYFDSQVGKILSLLDEVGLDENTIVMFSSDNGPTFNGGVDAAYFNSTGGFRGMKMDVYEGGIRMPMIARWPGKIKAGSKTDHISAQYDVMATLAELSGAKAPETTDGISFLPTMLGNDEDQEQHEFLYFEYPARGQIAIRMGKWKAVKTDLIPHPDNPWQLYNLEEDKFETQNVAEEHPDLLVQFDEILKREHRPSHVERWNFVDKVLDNSLSARK